MHCHCLVALSKEARYRLKYQKSQQKVVSQQQASVHEEALLPQEVEVTKLELTEVS